MECCSRSRIPLWRMVSEMIHCYNAEPTNLTSSYQVVTIKLYLIDVSEHPNKMTDCHYRFCYDPKGLLSQ